MIKFFKWFLGIFLILCFGIFALIYFGVYRPKTIEHLPWISPTGAPKLKAGQSFKVMTWNVQYMAGTDYVFWYEGGEDLKPSKESIQTTLKKVAEVIIRENPDIILFQELDEGASRSYGNDQLKSLLAYLPPEYQSYCSAFYWKIFFIPHPKIRGSVGMKLSVLSKYQINGAVRHQLALEDRRSAHWYDPFLNWFNEQFNLRRAVLEVSFPLEPKGSLTVFNTHLTAYPGPGSDVLSRQVEQVGGLLHQKDLAKTPWIIGGDFNLLPPGVNAEGLKLTEGEFYNPQSEIKKLYDKYKAIPDFKAFTAKNSGDWLTYTPNRKSTRQADRCLDYFFLSKQIKTDTSYVLQKNTQDISDHFPLLMQIQIASYE